MKLEQALSITDLRRLAKRRLPRVLLEAIESGVVLSRGYQTARRGSATVRNYSTNLVRPPAPTA